MKKIIFSFFTALFIVSIGYSQVTTLWEKSAAASTKPFWEAGSLTRGIAYGLVNSNHRLYVANRDASLGGKQIFVFNALTGDSVAMLDVAVISGGTYPINDVEVSTDGIIFVCNLTTNSNTSAFKVYKYTSESAAPVEVINYTSATGYRLGDKMTVTGSTANNSIIIWAANATATGEIVKFTTTDNGNTFTPDVISVGTLTSFSSAAVGPLPNQSFYFNAHGMNAQKRDSAGTLIGTIPNIVFGTSGSALRYMNLFAGSEFVTVNDLLVTSNNAKILKIPGGDPTLATSFAVTPLLGSTSAGGLGDIAVQKVSEYLFNVYVLSTNNGFGAYQVDIRTQLAGGDYYIPQGSHPQGFATLNEAVNTINNGLVTTGTINLLLDADTLRASSFTFNASLSATNNVVVKPAPGRDVVLFVTSSASMGNGVQMIGFNKGHVTFDGSNNGTNSRNLIVSTEEDAVAVPFGLNTSDADSVVLKNLIIKNLDNVTTNFRYGAVINDKNDVWGFRVENCQIGTADRPVRRDGLAPWGSTAPNQFSFINNEIYAGVRGVTTLMLTNSEIIGNTINLIPTTATGGSDAYNHGIYITGASGSLDINENTINCLSPLTIATSYLIGIAFAGNDEGGSSWINIFNNMINVGAASETRPVYGIGLRSANPHGNLKIYYNTIVVNNVASTLTCYGIGNHSNGTGKVNIDLKDNIIINKHTGNTGSSAIGIIPATSTLVSDFNDLLSSQNLVNYKGTLYADLSAWQVAGQDSNSVSKDVTFVSATDLHLSGASNGDVELAGTPIAEVTTDIDGDVRSLTFPYMGADEASVPIPVELTSFTANFANGSVLLEWTTATETNNQGFEIQRKSDGDFTTLDFVNGHGTTTQKQSYSFTDKDVKSGTYSYRLKQIDFNGTYSYSNIIEVEAVAPTTFSLSQNYPNPFNPTTRINYSVPFDSKVTITVYSITGELVAELVNNNLAAGSYSVDFNGSNLASGMYIYKMTAGSFTQVNKMMLMK